MQRIIKNILPLAFLCSSVLLSAAPTAGTKSPRKALIAYFSVPESDGVDASTGASRLVVEGKRYGATEYVATLISRATGGELLRIKTQRSYPDGDHQQLVESAKREADAKIYPKLATKINNLAAYDVIFVGYPNWWYDMPMAIYSLFRDYDFSGKTIVLFCTHGGSGFSQSVQTVKGLEQDATVLSIPAISRNNVDRSRQGVERWLKAQGWLK